MKRACYNCHPMHWARVYGPTAHAQLTERLDFGERGIPETGDLADLLRRAEGAELMLTSWQALPLTAEVLDHCPDLKWVIHAAGTVKPFVTEDLLDRGVRVSSAVAVNGKAVAEFCLGVILTAMKDGYRYPVRMRESYSKEAWKSRANGFRLGYYKSKIGLIGFGNITQSLLGLLRNFEFDVYVSSGYFLPEHESMYNAQRADSDWIFANCDLVSLHSADVPRNWNQVNPRTLGLMKEGACLLNTARGRLVDEAALVAALGTRDLVAILDVTHPEPPEPDNPLLKLPNCFILPHISGSIGREVERLGNFVLEEVDRYLAGQELIGEVDLSALGSIA